MIDFYPLAKWLDRKDYLQNVLKQISNTYVRAEIIHDRYPSFYDVHVDLLAKNLTIILNIDKEDEKNLATDLHSSKDTHAKKLDWVPNGGVGVAKLKIIDGTDLRLTNITV